MRAALRRLPSAAGARRRLLSTGPLIKSPPLVYTRGEEVTKYCMDLILEKWVEPRLDTSAWEFYDLSCVARDDSEDRVLHDAVAAGARIGAIFKEPTVTPTEVQKKKLGLRKSWGSPNGAMRRGWNGITISRDTIHIEGMELGYKRPVLFERHAVGGEYGAGWKQVGSGRMTTTFHPADGGEALLVDCELDRVGGGPRAQVVHARLEPLLPAVEVHRAKLGEGGLRHEDVERLRLVDERAAVGGHVDERALRHLPCRLEHSAQVRRNRLDPLHRAAGRDDRVAHLARPQPEIL